MSPNLATLGKVSKTVPPMILRFMSVPGQSCPDIDGFGLAIDGSVSKIILDLIFILIPYTPSFSTPAY